MALTDKLTGIADAIRGKTGKTEEMTLDQMATEIEGIETGGGGESLLAGHLNRTIEHYSDSEVLGIPDYVFYYNAVVKSVDFPKAKAVGASAFQKASKLMSVHMPSVTSIGASGFRETKITAANFPVATSIGRYAFSMVPLESINIPKITTLPTAALQQTNLTVLDLPSVTLLDDQALSNNSSLTTVVLRHTSVVTMKYTSVFNGTPFYSGGTGGTVYVPSALIEDYKVATNWSALYEAGSLTFAAIEGSEYE